MSLPLDTMDITDHAHIPFPVILVRALEEWRREREQGAFISNICTTFADPSLQ